MRNKYGYVKVATGVFEIKLGDVEHNVNKIKEMINKAIDEKIDVITFPELCITGYSCQDMFLRKYLIDDAETGLMEIANETKYKDYDPIVIVGLPMRNDGHLYNCAAIICRGKILAIVPKTYIPNYNEFYEKRWFASALDSNNDTIRIGNDKILFGTNVIIETTMGIKLACEICEDLWVHIPPSSYHTMNGANIIVNPSASNEIVSKREYRKNLVSMQSARCNCAYVYASAGGGESTTDVVYSGHQIIAETGSIKAETTFNIGDSDMITTAIIDLEKIENDEVRMNSFNLPSPTKYNRIFVEQEETDVLPTYVNPYPFIPHNKEKRNERCKEIIRLQASGLATRLKKTGIKKTVIGVSGGLDSTLALLVIKDAYDILKYPYSDIVGITMPGFGTTKQTRTSADSLMELLGIDARTVDITNCCRQHMKDIGQPEDCYDVTYENIQARERTQILMDVANKENALVIGTGDLSELALGWCTYNGDHMSMYGVNTSVPKTLVKFIIETYAENQDNEELRETLLGVCNTTISPELLPPDENGNIKQSTEDSIGKYDLHDFFLYHYIRNAFSPEKIRQLAYIAFKNHNITKDQIDNTLRIFVKRFRQNQFKRSCLPDGPKVGTVALSPRGDWRMPSDYEG